MRLRVSDLGSSYSLLSMSSRQGPREFAAASTRKISKSKQLAVTQACPESLSQVIIDDSERSPEGSCHGHRQTGAGHCFHSAVVNDFF